MGYLLTIQYSAKNSIHNVTCRNIKLLKLLKIPIVNDEAFVISTIIKVEVSVISQSRRLLLITLTETLTISNVTKTESNNCFIIHCFKENNDKHIIAPNAVYFRQAMFLLRCLWTWHCPWKSCIARATYRLFIFIQKQCLTGRKVSKKSYKQEKRSIFCRFIQKKKRKEKKLKRLKKFERVKHFLCFCKARCKISQVKTE